MLRIAIEDRLPIGRMAWVDATQSAAQKIMPKMGEFALKSPAKNR